MSEQRYIHSKTADVRFLDSSPARTDWTGAAISPSLRNGLRTRKRLQTYPKLNNKVYSASVVNVSSSNSSGVTTITKASKVAGGK